MDSSAIGTRSDQENCLSPGSLDFNRESGVVALAVKEEMNPEMIIEDNFEWTPFGVDAKFQMRTYYSRPEDYRAERSFKNWDWKTEVEHLANKENSVPQCIGVNQNEGIEKVKKIKEKTTTQFPDSTEVKDDVKTWEFLSKIYIKSCDLWILFTLLGRSGSERMDLHIEFCWGNLLELYDDFVTDTEDESSLESDDGEEDLVLEIENEEEPQNLEFMKFVRNYTGQLIRLDFLDNQKNVAFSSHLHMNNAESESLTFRDFCSVEEIQGICKQWDVTLDGKTKAEGFDFRCQLWFKNFSVDCMPGNFVEECSNTIPRFQSYVFNHTPENERQDSHVAITVMKGETVVENILVHAEALAESSDKLCDIISSISNGSGEGSREIILDSKTEGLSGKVLRLFAQCVFLCLQKPMGLAIEDMNTDVDTTLGILQMAVKYKVADVIDTCIGYIVASSDSNYSLELALQVFYVGIILRNDCLCFRSLQWLDRNEHVLNDAGTKELVCKFIRKHRLSSTALCFRVLSVLSTN